MKLTEQELKELIYRNIDFVNDEEYYIFYHEITKYGMEIDELIQGIREYFNNKIEQNNQMLRLQETIKLSDFLVI